MSIISHMNTSINNNRRQLKKDRNKFKMPLKDNQGVYSLIAESKELTEEERKAMEIRVQKIIAKDRRVSLIRNTVIIGLALATFIWLIIGFFSV